ncbi:MAG TPA: SAM-dependent chlorinase/fluorinase [Alphaproteobacteria bacterium]|nr:SAM-dependent chlorinase/fluorinase [Alphaproteobacteria bacterium]
MIVLFTDFGAEGPYLGQVKAAIHGLAPMETVIDLVSDAPAYDPMASAYLLAALAPEFPHGTVILAVVDPGVGGARRPAVAEIEGRWYVGPDNGLLEPLLRRSEHGRWWEIVWQPKRLSSSFHGRDLFAPIAARLALQQFPWDKPHWREGPWAEARPIEDLRRRDWPDDLARIVYIDRFGNAMTGLRASMLADDAALEVAGQRLERAQTFGDVPAGAAFWYANANGLAEIAVNRGRADRALGLEVGAPIAIARAERGRARG